VPLKVGEFHGSSHSRITLSAACGQAVFRFMRGNFRTHPVRMGMHGLVIDSTTSSTLSVPILTSARSFTLFFARGHSTVLAEQRQKNATATHGTIARRADEPACLSPSGAMPECSSLIGMVGISKLRHFAAAFHCHPGALSRGACACLSPPGERSGDQRSRAP
jgi:hypothetical protein